MAKQGLISTLLLIFTFSPVNAAEILLILDTSKAMGQSCSDNTSTRQYTALELANADIKRTVSVDGIDLIALGGKQSAFTQNQRPGFKFNRLIKKYAVSNTEQNFSQLIDHIEKVLVDNNVSEFNNIILYTHDIDAPIGAVLTSLTRLSIYSANIELRLFSPTEKSPVTFAIKGSTVKLGFYICPEQSSWKAYIQDIEREVLLRIADQVGQKPQPEDIFTTDLGLDSYGAFTLQSSILNSYGLTGKVDQPIVNIRDLILYIAEEQKRMGQVDNLGISAKARQITATEPDSAYIQKVFYSTNRKLSKETGVFFNGKREIQTSNQNSELKSDLQYGACEVAIPKSHKKGILETPLLNLNFFRDPKDHIFIQSVKPLSQKEFYHDINSYFENGNASDMSQHTVIFVHGFNVTFSNAVQRTAQLAYDFGFTGVPILFSWPSDGKLFEYASDYEDAIWSVQYLENFLIEISGKLKSRKIHLVAHSMGNQVLLGALNQLALKGKSDLFDNILLAAPDYDSLLFRYLIAPRVTNLAKTWTIYTSKNDVALNISTSVNSVKRLGLPITEVKNMDIIDASNVEVTPWSVPEFHSYYATKEPIINDMVQTIQGLAPDKRKLIPVEQNNYRYWKFAESD